MKLSHHESQTNSQDDSTHDILFVEPLEMFCREEGCSQKIYCTLIREVIYIKTQTTLFVFTEETVLFYGKKFRLIINIANLLLMRIQFCENLESYSDFF